MEPVSLVLLWLGLAVLFGLYACYRCLPWLLNRRLARAMAAAEEGDFEGALAMVDDSLRDSKVLPVPVLLVNKGALLGILGRFEESLATLREVPVQALRGELAFNFYNNLFGTLANLDRWDEANGLRGYLEIADPHEISESLRLSVRGTLATYELRRGDADVGRRELLALLQMERPAISRACYHYFLGMDDLDHSRYSEARQHFDAAARLCPTSWYGHRGRPY